MKWPPPPDLSRLSTEALRAVEMRANRELGREIDRLRIADAAFRAALDLTLAVEDEMERRLTR